MQTRDSMCGALCIGSILCAVPRAKAAASRTPQPHSMRCRALLTANIAVVS